MTDRHEQLIDYLYGEMNESDRRAFEEELHRDPALRRELDSLQITRQSLAELPDTQPPTLFITSPPPRFQWKKWGLRAAVAAAVLLFLVLMDARLEIGSDGLVFALGTPPDQGLDLPADQAEASINLQPQLEAQEKYLEDRLLQLDSAWTQQMASREARLQQAWQRQWVDFRQQQQAELTQLSEAFRENEMAELAGLMQNLQLQQQEKLRLMLVDFWDAWQQTRAADLQSIESEFVNLYQNVERTHLEIQND